MQQVRLTIELNLNRSFTILSLLCQVCGDQLILPGKFAQSNNEHVLHSFTAITQLVRRRPPYTLSEITHSLPYEIDLAARSLPIILVHRFQKQGRSFYPPGTRSIIHSRLAGRNAILVSDPTAASCIMSYNRTEWALHYRFHRKIMLIANSRCTSYDAKRITKLYQSQGLSKISVI